MKKQLIKVRDRVEKLLRENPHLRDDDFKLIANVWHAESKGVETKADFLWAFSRGKFSHPESIRRSRAKLQELNPELRGTSYRGRTNEAEKETRDYLNHW